jgi:hypothetical protein
VAAFLLLLRLRRQRPELWPWAVYILAALAVVGRIPAYGPRYITPVVPAMFGFFGLFAGPWLARLPRTRAALLVVTLAATCLLLLTRLPGHYPVRPDHSMDPFISSVRALPTHPGMRVFVPQISLPSLHYYFPELALLPYDGDLPKTLQAEAAVTQAGNAYLIGP